MKHYLIIALLAVVTVSTASAGDKDWLADARAGVVARTNQEACKQRGGNWVTLVPRTVEGNPWAKSMAPVSGCWEAKTPVITFAAGPPIQVLACDWRKLFENFIGASAHCKYLQDPTVRSNIGADTEAAQRFVKRRAAPPPAMTPVMPRPRVRNFADI